MKLSALTFVIFSWAIFLTGRNEAIAAVANQESAPTDRDISDLGSSNPAEQKTAESRIRKGGPSSVPFLLKGLDDPNATTRERATWFLRQLKYEFKSLPNDLVATSIGRKVHQERDLASREQMVMALRDYSGPVAVRELERLASEDTDEGIRKDATHYAVQVAQDPKREIAFLRVQTRDKNVAVQMAAYCELAKQGDFSGRDAALKIIQGHPSMARYEALGVIGATGNPSDMPMLDAIFKSKSEDTDTRIRAFQEFKNLQLMQLPRDKRLDFLINALDEKYSEARRWAYSRLWNYPDVRTSDRLREYLSEKGHRGYTEAANALSMR